jgi:energy-coupling factor transporter ATP-binding protein EcfA2/predicted GNAT family acetyltransferase
MANIELKTKILNDKYTEYVYEAFDIQNREETSVSIPMNLGEAKNFDWNIGVILGGSGSGKTTILKKMGDVKKINFDAEKPLISNFDWLEPKDATLVLTSMGLSSVPTWLRPFSTLSNGEQYRATLAYLVASAKDGEVILVDEYTSVVDRDVAKAMSFALQKYIRRENKKIIIASCHYDILEWLMPDWTCSPQKGGALERGDWRRQGRPQITLQVSRVKYDTWDFFKKHHYLTEELNKSFNLLLFSWNDKPVGIVVYKSQPTGAVPNGYGLSRTVVTPDFQGMGIGSKIAEFVSGILKNEGKRVFTKTVNPALGEYRERSVFWKGTSKNRKIRKDAHTDNAGTRLARASYCHEYIGESISGYEDLLLPIKEMRTKNEITLFN